MAKECRFISTDATGQEISQTEWHRFDVRTYRGDVAQYIGGCIAAHWHEQMEVFLLESGEVELEAGGQRFRMRAGDGCFINAGQIHAFYTLHGSDGRYRSMVFAPELVGGAAGSVFDAQYVQPLLKEGAACRCWMQGDPMAQCFERAFLACETADAGYEFRVRDALSEIIFLLGRELPPTPSGVHPQEQHLKVMLRWIQEHLSRDGMSVSNIAEAAHLSVRECQRVFIRCLHYTPMEYVRLQRLHRASELLSGSSRSITEIAMACGFSSSAYFAKLFRESVGMSPREFRKRGSSI